MIEEAPKSHPSESISEVESRVSAPLRFVVDAERLPKDFPTHLHSANFWEELGRVVATCGFLEETLGKAVFSFTATREYSDDEVTAAYEKWLLTLQRALSDPLGSLIELYGSAVRNHGKATIANLDELLADLRKASSVRNVLCHGSWRQPDAENRSLPLFVNRQNEIFETSIDVAFLRQMRLHVLELACAVINSVTHMGWQFPGSDGPGVPILADKKHLKADPGSSPG